MQPTALLILQFLPVLVATQCATDDYGVAFNGQRVFAVLSSNNTCTCANFDSPGLATFRTAVIPSLTVETLTAGTGSSFVVNGSAVFNGGIVGNGNSPNRQLQVDDELHVGSLVTIGGAYRCGGLRGYYYRGTALADPSACTQVDATLSFSWMAGPCTVCAAADLPCTAWSARWIGYLLAPTTGNITLSLTVDDGLRLWWNNEEQPLMNTWTEQNGTVITATVPVVQSSYYPLRIEYFQASYRYEMSFRWFWPGQAIAAVPSSNLCSATGVHVIGTSTIGGHTTFKGPVLFAAGIGTPNSMTTFLGPMLVQGSATFPNGIGSTSTLTSFNGPVTVLGSTRFAQGIGSPSDNTTFNGPVTVVGAALFAGGIGDSSTGTTVAGPLTVQGVATLSGGIGTPGTTTTLNGPTAVQGVATFAVGIGLANTTTTVNGPMAVAGPATFPAGIGSSGFTTAVLGPMSVEGVALFPGGISNSVSTTTFRGPMAFQGATTFAAGVTVAGGQAVNLMTTGSAGSVTIGSSGVLSTLRVYGPATFGAVTATTLVGGASGLTNLAAQPEFSALSAQAAVLALYNGQSKSCGAGTAIRQINSDGTVVCATTTGPMVAGAVGAVCLDNSDCVCSGCACTSGRCLVSLGGPCGRDVECATGGALCSNGFCRVATTSGAPAFTNPSFEDGAHTGCGYSVTPGYLNGLVQGWTYSNAGVSMNSCPFAQSTTPPHGSYVAFGQGDASITQTVSGWEVGRKYRINAYITYRQATSNNIQTRWTANGNVIFGPVFMSPSYLSASYTKATTPVFVATATSMPIVFASISQGVDASVLYDNLSIEMF
eukprot:TRINITY_DN264_c0_g1_i2.p1 TRINITY_DN264_c0_g1~~TRINITY_DN264_c0_g1_i2.p1  ORF type:complete len:824 (+),score=202.27 TRINITY_DN264_c0_g1_i2:107-2578(+)